MSESGHRGGRGDETGSLSAAVPQQEGLRLLPRTAGRMLMVHADQCESGDGERTGRRNVTAGVKETLTKGCNRTMTLLLVNETQLTRLG